MKLMIHICYARNEAGSIFGKTMAMIYKRDIPKRPGHIKEQNSHNILIIVKEDYYSAQMLRSMAFKMDERGESSLTDKPGR